MKACEHYRGGEKKMDIAFSTEKNANHLVKVELGCGRTKNEGYIGIDRFEFPGVDIVADLNEGIPMEDNSVDILYAGGSLEHLENLSHTMSEIYRVCRNRAIVYVIAPYHNTSVNQANVYHKQVFNEDTFRFFSCDPVSLCVDSEEYYCPHAPLWGLGQSDNSVLLVNFELINMEFFYYKEYRHLTEVQKRHARKALSNVCDLIYYVLVVNKGEKLSEDDLKTLNGRAQIFEPQIVSSLRARDTVCEPGTSIVTDLQDEIHAASADLQGEFRTALTEMQNKFQTALNDEINKASLNADRQFMEMREDIEQEDAFYLECSNELKKLSEALFQLRGEIKNANERQEIVNRDVEQKQMGLNQSLLELLKKQPVSTAIKDRLHLFDPKSNLFPTLSASCPQFIESIILDNDQFRSSSILQMSGSIPFETYAEYRLIGYGEQLAIYFLGVFGSKCLVEIVSKGVIVKQNVIVLLHEGPHSIPLPSVKGEIFVRFRTLDSYSILRVLEISNRRYGLFAEKSLAAYIV